MNHEIPEPKHFTDQRLNTPVLNLTPFHIWNKTPILLTCNDDSKLSLDWNANDAVLDEAQRAVSCVSGKVSTEKGK